MIDFLSGDYAAACFGRVSSQAPSATSAAAIHWEFDSTQPNGLGCW